MKSGGSSQHSRAESESPEPAERELAASITELKRSNQFMAGRELRMVDLKREVNMLLARLKEEPKYPLTSWQTVRRLYEKD